MDHGKTTTANAILNNPMYNKTNGSIYFEDEDITNSKTDEIARKGVFMSFQLPEEIGFSGGEKKKNEILQMYMLKPKLAILDETDSGLDVDAIKTVSKGIELFKNEENAVLIITHNTKILHSLKVDYVHILVDGKIVKTAGQDLAKFIEENGYEMYK